MQEKESLGHDGSWMKGLAIAQLICLILFLIWRYFAKLQEPSQEADDSDEQQTMLLKIQRDAEKVALLHKKCEDA